MPYDIDAILRMNAEAAEQERQEAERQQREAVTASLGKQIVQIPIGELVDFPAEKHRFKPATGQRLTDLEESIRVYGIINPLIVRRLSDGRYQIIAGHNRRTAARNIGYQEVPCILRELMDEDDALGVLVSDNLQNRELLPSERGWAYRDLMDIRKRQGHRTDLTSSQSGTKLNTADIIGKPNGDNRNKVYRYIRLTYLIPQLLDLVDQGKIGIGTGEQLSHLKQRSQELIYCYCYAVEKPRPLKENHARQLREIEADPDQIIDEDLLEELLAPKKKVRFRTLKIEMTKLRDYFPTGTPEDVVIQTIHAALAVYFEGKSDSP
ncbi:MAG: ParB/RepB/Spo0J family partition protein [Oscillospiraceae bacterium]|nr:ParB/RepB/Spo0J family partition protein [Oscillospiraceae bacterium]